MVWPDWGQRLEAGANVVTSLVPAGQGLAGVAQRALDIEAGRRTVEGIAQTLRACGLQPATAGQYRNWIEERKRTARLHDRRGGDGMLAAIVGGRLQGVELACLARNAGWRTVLVDRKTHVPAQRLGDRFLHLDVTLATALDDAMPVVDLVIPALEDQVALDSLVQWGRDRRVPVAFDPGAYAVSSSKNRFGPALCRLRYSPSPSRGPSAGFRWWPNPAAPVAAMASFS